MFMLLQLLLELVTAVLCVAATVYVEPPFAERRMPARRDAPSSTYEASTQSVAGLVAVDAAVALVERKRPTLVATSTIAELVGSTFRSRIVAAVTVPPTPAGYAPVSGMAAVHVPPPSVERTTCPPCVSTKSPRPAQSVSGACGSRSNAPMARLPMVSVIGTQVGAGGVAALKSYDFHTPPPEVAM